ncbi:methyl-accepting chemotaxis protein [Ideonella sp. DXS29W]|uniref:Methyl-accepting chemotaxis protein n=1 Tax=Ideonella lacteola TaxID=2984193 RepID=A0ABU9BWF0_9BURK
MKTVSIKNRLIGLVGLSAVATLSVAGIAWYDCRTGLDASERLAATTAAVRASMNADMMHDSIRATVFGAQVAAITNNAAALAEAAKELDESGKAMVDSFKSALDADLPKPTHEAVASAEPAVQRYIDAARKTLATLKDSPADTAPVMSAFLKEFDTAEAALAQSGDAIESLSQQLEAETAARLQQAQIVTVAVIGGSLTLLAVMAYVVIASIMVPLARMLRAVINLNSDDGDLSRRLPPATAEFGQVSHHFNTFLDKVATVVGNVQAAAREISNTSAQIAAGNMDLSTRTEQGSASLQQAASSMEQITTTVTQSTESARQANEVATGASGVAAKGGEAVSRVIATMDDINAASRKIGDIIGVIDGIAFQTNILALNAAVEAARAGEQGRGFAVVAGEVRMLAQRSAEAAREIKTLIGTSVDKVEAGSRLVRDAGATMDEIVTSVNRVSLMIQEITNAAAEQSAGIGLVNRTVADLDVATQQNTALVEETAAVAKDMAEQARSLEAAVGVFRVKQHAE